MKKVLCFLFLVVCIKADAQVSAYTWSQYTGSFVSIAGRPGTVDTMFIGNDIIHPGIPIGFNFVYNLTGCSGTTYNVMSVQDDGNAVFGTANNNNDAIPLSVANCITPMGIDLNNRNPGSGEFYQTSGTAPYRVFVYEWKDMNIKQHVHTNMNLQIRLYETTNIIEFVYGLVQADHTNYTMEVGLSGPNPTTDFNDRATTNNWTATTAGGYLATCPFTIGIFPPNGLTFRWTPPCVSGNVTMTSPLCHGQCNGTATANPLLGIAPFRYHWSTGQTQQTISGLCAGSYSVTLTDAVGNRGVASATVTEPALLSTAATTTRVTCHGGSDGTATISANGGTGIYTYLWNTSPAQTTATATGLSAGTFTVTVSDNNGCNLASTVPVAEPATVITLSTASINAGCGLTNGSASVTAAGGTPGYSYMWNTTPVQTTATALNLQGGNYAVTVTDNGGCTITTSVVVSVSGGPTATVTSVSDVSCYGGNNGSATVTVSGGSPPFSYYWNTTPAQTGVSAIGLTAGNYLVTITDIGGCFTTLNISITEPQALSVSFTQTPVSCHGGSNGSITASSFGGVSPMTYHWSTGINSSTNSNLVQGTYFVTVTDAHSCTATASTLITEPAAVSATAQTIDNVSCHGGNNGLASVTGAGGTSPFSYDWSNGSTTSTATGFMAGTYFVTVTDANSCTGTAMTSFTEPPALSVTITSIVNVTCYGDSNGVVAISASGGVLPFSYNWSTGDTNAIDTGLFARDYYVIVTDANGCTRLDSATVTEPPPIVLNFPRNYVICSEAGGSVMLTASGGNSYLWTPAAGLSNDTIPNPIATDTATTTYVVTVFNGPCSDTASVTVTILPTPAAPNITVIGDSLFVPLGYVSYQWYLNGNAIADTNFYHIAVDTGYYSVLLIDSNGCRVITPSIPVILPYVPSMELSSAIKMFPNPVTSELSFLDPSHSALEVQIYDVFGRKISSYNLADNNSPVYTIDVSNLAKGIYFVQVAGKQGVWINKIVKE